MKMPKKLRVAIYCRLSEEDRNKQSELDDSNSIANQKLILTNHALKKNWEIAGIYSDDNYAGADRNRPEFKRMLQDAEDHKFDIILCKTLSRFTREVGLVEKYLHESFLEWGIRFVSIVDNIDTDSKDNKKSRQINSLINEWYLEDMSDNIKTSLRVRREQGYHIGSSALYGYQKDPNEKGHLIIDEEAAQVVREVFTLFSEGYGKTAIARMLNDREIPNPTEYKRLKGLHYQNPKQKNSHLWKYFAISNMLQNEMYIGNMVQGKYGSISCKTKKNKPRPKEEWYKVEGTHEPIIDRELWDKVQMLRKQRAKPCADGKEGLFARKVRCMNCGYTMRSNKQSDGRRYLMCSNHHVSKDACIGSFISIPKLEQVIVEEINQLSSMYLNKDELEQKVDFNKNLHESKKNLEQKVTDYQKKVSYYTEAIRELYLDKIKKIITEQQYLEFSKDFLKEKDRTQELIADTQNQIDVIEKKIQDSNNRRELIEQYTNIEHLDRETLDKLIDYILVGKKDPVTKEVPVEIHWNF